MKFIEPCPCGSGKKYKKCCGDTEDKQKAVNEKLHNHEEIMWGELLTLVQLLLSYMDKGDKIGNPRELDYIPWAQAVCGKILVHFLTFIHICKGTVVPELNFRDKKIDISDHSSAAIIMRAAFENYLTFYNLFIHPPTNEKRDFLLKVWDLGDKRLREKILVATKQQKSIVEELKSEADKLRDEIMLDPIYSQLSTAQQKEAKKGEWRLKQSWRDLSGNAGFSEGFFNSAYSIISSEAHTGKTSIHRIQWSAKQQGLSAFLISPMQQGLVILGQLLDVYPTLFPGFEICDLPDYKKVMARVWKEVGDKILH